METLTVDELVNEARVGGVYRLEGWLYNRASIESGIRLILRDRTGLITCDVHTDDVEENTVVIAGGVERHSRLAIEGRLESDDAMDADRVFRVKDITVINESDTYHTEDDGFAADVDQFWLEPDRMSHTAQFYDVCRQTIEAILQDRARYLPLPPDDGQPTYPWGYLEAAFHGLGEVYTERQYPTHRWFLQFDATELDELVTIQKEILSEAVRTICDDGSSPLSFFERDPDALTRKTADIKEETPATLQHWDPDDATASSRHLSLPTIVTDHGDDRYFVRDDDGPVRASLYAPDGHGQLMDAFVLEDDPMTVMRRIQDADELPEKYRRIIESKRHGNIASASLTIDIETLASWIAGRPRDDLVPFRD